MSWVFVNVEAFQGGDEGFSQDLLCRRISMLKSCMFLRSTEKCSVATPWCTCVRGTGRGAGGAFREGDMRGICAGVTL